MVHSFGDSFAYGHCQGLDLEGDRLDCTYAHHVANHYNMRYVNHGMPGASYLDILNSITAKLSTIKRGDIVLVAGTSNTRFQIPTDYIMPLFKEKRKSKYGVGIGGRENEADMSTTTLVWVHKKTNQDKIKHIQELLPTKLSNKELSKIVQAYEVLIDSIIYRHDGHIHQYYQDWILSFFQYFEERRVRCIAWDNIWWDLINRESKSKCTCGHWDEKGHEVFSKYLIQGLEEGVNLMRKGDYTPNS